MKPLFIIPARGGSKGIPHKNIKPLGGRPLIAHSIALALDVSRRMGLDRSNVLVSTDSAEIAAVAAEAELRLPICVQPNWLQTRPARAR